MIKDKKAFILPLILCFAIFLMGCKNDNKPSINTLVSGEQEISDKLSDTAGQDYINADEDASNRPVGAKREFLFTP